MFLYENNKCPVCGKEFAEGDDVVSCPECGTPHHRECYKSLGKCVNKDKHGTDFVYNRNNNEESADAAEIQTFEQFIADNGKAYEDESSESSLSEAVENKAEEAKTEVQQKQSSENDIDGVSTYDAATVVGVNSERFVKRFSKNGKLGWNWGAFFFGPYYFMYRKMYTESLIFLVLPFAASAIISKVFESAMLVLKNIYTEMYGVMATYDTEKMTIGGTTSAKDAGNYEAIFTLKPNYQWPDGTTDPKTVVWVIGKAEPIVNPYPSSLSLTSSSPTGRINLGSRIFSGKLSAFSNNTEVATVSEKDVDPNEDTFFFLVTGKANGTATITVTSEEDNNYFAGSWTVEVTVSFGPVAKLEPTAGVTYTNGISSLTDEKLNEYARAISDNASINNETSVVYVDDESNHYKISIGDSIAVHAEYYSIADMLIKVDSSMRILGFNHDDLADKSAYGAITTTGKAGFTFRISTYFGPWPMSGSGSSSDVATNVGNWEKSQIRTYVFEHLKTTFDSVKKTVKKKTSKGGQSTEIITTEDGAFILSVVEAYGNTQNYAVDGEGTQYAWFKAGNLKPDKDWARSPYKSSSTNFCYFTVLPTDSAPPVVRSAASTSKKEFQIGLCI